MLKVEETSVKSKVEYEVHLGDHTIEHQCFNIYKVKLSDLHKELVKLCKAKGVKIAKSKNGSIAENIKMLDKYIQEKHIPDTKEWYDRIKELDYIHNDKVDKKQLEELIEVGSDYARFGSGNSAIHGYVDDLYSQYERTIKHISNSNTVTKIGLIVSYQELERRINKYQGNK